MIFYLSIEIVCNIVYFHIFEMKTLMIQRIIIIKYIVLLGLARMEIGLGLVFIVTFRAGLDELLFVSLALVVVEAIREFRS